MGRKRQKTKKKEDQGIHQKAGSTHVKRGAGRSSSDSDDVDHQEDVDRGVEDQKDDEEEEDEEVDADAVSQSVSNAARARLQAHDMQRTADADDGSQPAQATRAGTLKRGRKPKDEADAAPEAKDDDEKKELPSLTVMSWNMQKKSGDEINTDSMLAMAKANGCHVLCVQEPPQGLKAIAGRRGAGTHGRTGYNVYYDASADCAIITDPTLQCTIEPLVPSRQVSMQGRRAVMIATITDPDGRSIRIATVHAPYGNATEAGPFMNQVFKTLPGLEPQVHMLLGDTNLYGVGSGQRSGSRSQGARMQGFDQLDLPPTSNHGKGSPLDQIFVRSDASSAVSSFGRVLPDRSPPVPPVFKPDGSQDWEVPDRMGIIARPDHLPVYAQLGPPSDAKEDDEEADADVPDVSSSSSSAHWGSADDQMTLRQINAELRTLQQRMADGSATDDDNARFDRLNQLKVQRQLNR